MSFLILHKTLVSTIRFSLTSLTSPFIRTMSSSTELTHRMFQLKLDPLTGNSEWVVIEDEEHFSEISQKSLLATTSYLDMLNDSRRNKVFREAIEKVVKGRTCHVLDIGAGTGLLSLMAARAMNSGDNTSKPCTEGMITACESYLPMVKLMRKVMRLNDMEKKIKLFNKRSDELEVGVHIPSRANVLVSEILDSELLGEGLIPTLQHAHDNLLTENVETVPYKATTYGQLVESNFLWKLHDLYNNEEQAQDGIHLVPTGLETIFCAKQQQYPIHCDAIQEISLLSEPFKIFEFDFWKRPDSHRETDLRIKTTKNGTVNAVISWWLLQLDREGTIFYSTAPKWITSALNTNDVQTPVSSSGEWCDHWKQCAWFVPGKGLSIFKDDEVHLRANHTDTSISYKVETQNLKPENGQHQNNCTGDQLILSPERVAIYGDRQWRQSMRAAVTKALQEKDCSLCVVADDSVFLTIVAAQHSKEARVMSLFPGLRDKGTEYLKSVAQANDFSVDRVTVIGKRKACLTIHDTDQKKVDMLIAEPFYYGYGSGLPWQNLRFWKERTLLDPILAKDVVIMPCKGILKGCAMSLPDLWSSLRSLDRIEGFDHSAVNFILGANGDSSVSQERPCLPFFTWQCGEIKELSIIFTVMEFDFLKPISACSGNAKVEFTKPGTCHGFIFWIDWVMDAESSIVISTGPDYRYWKQAVKLLDTPIDVPIQKTNGNVECCTAMIDATFDPSTGEVLIRPSLSL